MNTLDWAIEYMDHGYPVIPVKNKVPIIPWKEYQFKRPTYDQLREWFVPGVNIAVVCGAASGVVVIDSDDARAQDWVRENCKATPMRSKTNRGWHNYYGHPGDYVQSKAGVIPGLKVDRKGDGGLCTGLGSVHESGHLYCLEANSDLISVHDLPLYDHSWFPKPVVTVRREKVAYEGIDKFDRASRYIRAIQGAGKGNRNQTAFQVAASVVRDFALDFEQGMVLMLEWNDQNDPPLPECEITAVVRSSLAAGKNPIGYKLRG